MDTRRPQPHQRIADVLRHVDWATAQFGLFRAEALRKTRLIDRFPACDYVLLLEVAILGEIREIPEVLFQRRFHAGVSTNANKTPTELAQWFDPSQKNTGLCSPRMKLALTPRVKLGIEYGRSITRMPLPAQERILCLLTAFYYWTARESRRLVPEYWSRVQARLAKLFTLFRRHPENIHSPVVENEPVSKKRL